MKGRDVAAGSLPKHRAQWDGNYLVFSLGCKEYGICILKLREIIGIMTGREIQWQVQGNGNRQAERRRQGSWAGSGDFHR